MDTQRKHSKWIVDERFVGGLVRIRTSGRDSVAPGPTSVWKVPPWA
jgi:hypothetical protein